MFILCLVSNVVLPFSDSIFLSAVVKRRKREHEKSEQNSTDHNIIQEKIRIELCEKEGGSGWKLIPEVEAELFD